ncbi:hypothetical protein, partial [Plantibacter sp. YIM 135347]|uniref:hypothetical protein n=1 Tax=Plantibacter sp. YIM 135347 TaxID=3423919 RepID=UPI003D348DE3
MSTSAIRGIPGISDRILFESKELCSMGRWHLGEVGGRVHFDRLSDRVHLGEVGGRVHFDRLSDRVHLGEVGGRVHFDRLSDRV